VTLQPPGINRSIAVPRQRSFWRKNAGLLRPGYLVAVGYMDPGNWATDLAGGSQFGYSLLSVILLSNLMAILLQSLCARLGIVTGATGASLSRPLLEANSGRASGCCAKWAICACDLAEVIGSAIGLNLLFKIPLIWGVCLTALDVLAVMYLQEPRISLHRGAGRHLILTIGACFLAEILFSKPSVRRHPGGFAPHLDVIQTREMLFTRIGILGATVMPHNLYFALLHRSDRNYEQNLRSKTGSH